MAGAQAYRNMKFLLFALAFATGILTSCLGERWDIFRLFLRQVP